MVGLRRGVFSKGMHFFTSKMTKCSANPSTFGLCNNMLSSVPSLKFIILLLGITIVVLDMTSVIVRMIPDYESNFIDKNIISLSTSDCIIGLYLISISGVDSFFAGDFV